MKKIVSILACMLVCFSLFSGCTGKKDKDHSGSSVEVPIDAETKGDAEITSGDSGIVYDLKDPENASGLVVTPKE